VTVADSEALRQRRSRRHRDGDHSLCRHGEVTPIRPAGSVGDLASAVRAEFSDDDELSRALALRLVDLAAGHGVAAVQALRALGELVSYQREGR
jgi:hypothetical protein